MRKNIVAGNWKMNMLQDEASQLVKDIIKEVEYRNDKSINDRDIIIIPPFPWIPGAVEKVNDFYNISIGAQNNYHEPKGAFTGEISPEMIKSAGADYVIVGHSERRMYFNESNEFLKQKVNAAIQAQLTPIFCCGEPLETRENNKQKELIEKQLQESLFHLTKEQISKIIIAYEPVWAIGTGKTASPEQAQEMHHFIRQLIAKKYEDAIAENMVLLYGGSCKPSNAAKLFAKQDVDGGLIGGASLKANDFIDIVQSFNKE
ncbi:MAG: triose-phosphate isomerase [Bacteroidales bacterium]